MKPNKLEIVTQENLRVLFTLMALGTRNDKAIAKTLGISSATMFRRKRILEQEGYIKEYTVIPDFHKIGIEFIVVTIVSIEGDTGLSDQIKGAQEVAGRHPEIIWMLLDQGMRGTNFVLLSVHRNYEEYLELSQKLRKEYAPLPPNFKTQSFMFHTAAGSGIFKPLSFRNLKSVLSPSSKANISPSKTITSSSEQKPRARALDT